MRENHEIISIIRQQMKENEISISELARRVDMSKSTISRYMNQSREFPVNKVNVFADVLNLDAEYILGFSKVDDISILYNQLNESRKEKVFTFTKQQLEEQNKVISIEETQTVYLNSKLSAGTGILDLDPADTKEIEYKGHVPKHDLAFMVDGDSMYPMFEDGEVVFVEKTPDIYNGQFIAVQINEEAYIKKVYVENGHLRLVSLNKEYDDIIASEDDDIRVIGRIIL